MSKWNDAVVAAKALSNQYRAVISLCEALEGLGSIDDAKADADAARVQAEQARNKALGELEHVLQRIEEAKGEAPKILSDAEAKAGAALAARVAKGDEIVAAAKAHAAKVIADANAEAGEIRKEIEGMKGDALALGRELASKAEMLKGIKAQLAEIKAKV
jgi:cell division septum initiation protein DivIVA